MERRDPNRLIADLERRVAGGIRLGVIEEIDYGAARARVRTGDNLTTWVPWTAARAGQGERTWDPPAVGEQVVIASPGGDLAQGVMIGSVYRNAHPAPGDRGDLRRTVLEDGTVIEHDGAAKRHSISIPAGGSWVVKIGGTEITGTEITGTEDTVTIKAATIVLHGTVKLGSPGASKKVHRVGDKDSDNDTAVEGASNVFTD